MQNLFSYPLKVEDMGSGSKKGLVASLFRGCIYYTRIEWNDDGYADEYSN